MHGRGPKLAYLRGQQSAAFEILGCLLQCALLLFVGVNTLADTIAGRNLRWLPKVAANIDCFLSTFFAGFNQLGWESWLLQRGCGAAPAACCLLGYPMSPSPSQFADEHIGADVCNVVL